MFASNCLQLMAEMTLLRSNKNPPPDLDSSRAEGVLTRPERESLHTSKGNREALPCSATSWGQGPGDTEDSA